MTGRLEGKVAIITGGASGMGRSTVLRFLAEGASVVVADMNEGNGKALLDEVADGAARADGAAGAARPDGDRIRFVRTDVSSEPDVEAMVATAVDAFGGLDIMFNNAGVGGAFGPVTEIHVEDWDWTFGVMCRGVFLGIKHAARAMKAAGRPGSIISTASVAGVTGGLGPMAYSAAKAGVINLTKSAAIELAADRIRVNCICPGAIATPLIAMGRDLEDVAKGLTTLQPWPEAGRGDDIAGAALFLASDDAHFVTGHALVVDGGLTVTGPRLMARIADNSPLAGRAGVSRGQTGEEPFTVH